MDNERLATENRGLAGRLSELDRVKGSNREFEVNISKLTHDNKYLVDENQKAQEGLRTSSVTLQKLSIENVELKKQLEIKERDLRNFQQRLGEA